MIMALVRLPPEVNSVHNQVLAGSTVPNYEVVSEQRLRLVTSHAFIPGLTSCSTESSTVASHYHGRGG